MGVETRNGSGHGEFREDVWRRAGRRIILSSEGAGSAARGLTGRSRLEALRGSGRDMSPFEQHVIRCGESEIAVEVVRVGGVQQPAEVAARPLLDHLFDHPASEPAAAVGGQDEDVGEVGQCDAVGYGSGETDLLVGGVCGDDSPGAVDLPYYLRSCAPAAPVRLLRQEPPDDLNVDPPRIVVEVITVIEATTGWAFVCCGWRCAVSHQRID